MLVDLAVGPARPRIRLPVSIPEDRPVAAAVPAELTDSVTRPFRKVSPVPCPALHCIACKPPSRVTMIILWYTGLHS